MDNIMKRLKRLALINSAFPLWHNTDEKLILREMEKQCKEHDSVLTLEIAEAFLRGGEAE